MTSATALGCDSIDTWLVGSSVVAALIFFAKALSASGWIIRSLAETMYQLGLAAHAAAVTFVSNAAEFTGTCDTAIRLASAGATSWAKSRAMVSGVNARYRSERGVLGHHDAGGRIAAL